MINRTIKEYLNQLHLITPTTELEHEMLGYLKQVDVLLDDIGEEFDWEELVDG